MKIIKINGAESSENSGFRAEIVFPSDNKYDVIVTDPFIEPDPIDGDPGQRLRWYFEEHLSSPYTEREKAGRAALSIPAYGETLFSALFADPGARAEWRKLVNGLETVRVRVFSKSREFQALHWEALKDPDETAACCLKGVEFVRVSPVKTPELPVEAGTRLNVLMVTARPGGKADIEYRTITRPVVETVEKKRMPVRVHLLRPPTFRELREHLRERPGFYHIIHFDVHGDVLEFDRYKKIMGGRKGSASYKGTRAFIFLEGETGGPDPVAAEDVAELLRGAHVPMCFLNACRSGMATESGAVTGGVRLDASLAMTFLERGVRLVLGMGWSLTVTAARIMVTALYEKLTLGEEPGTALNRARRALADDGIRLDAADCTVELEDWLLPVVWGKGEFKPELKPPYPEEVSELVEQKKKRKKELEGMKREGVYGFLGRDVDILVMERMLDKTNILLVKGMGGTGKTTLMGHAAEWWLKTGWLDHVYYFGYDEKPFRAEEILNRVAEGVMPPGAFGGFLVLPGVESKALRLSGFLKESKETPRVLLILDNMESITGTEKAVGSQLKKKDREELAAAIESLMDSTIKILLGSRGDEEWLGKRTFRDQVHVLEGLDHESRYQLAENILEKTGVTDVTGVDNQREFKRLMDILAGYPLAMEIILPNLATRGSKALREVLTGGDVDLKGGRVSEEIFKCINISFSLLSSEAKKSMLVFAPFTSFLNAAYLERYLNYLREFEPFSHLTLKDLSEALLQGEKQGLLKQTTPKLYSVQPVFPFFLGEQTAHSFDEKKRKGLEQAFCWYMAELAILYKQLMEAKEAEKKQMGFFLFHRDRENLYKALHQVLDNEDHFHPLYNIFALFYHLQPFPTEAIEFMEEVVKKLELYSVKDQIFLARYGYVVGNLGNRYQDGKKFLKAKSNYNKGLSLLKQAGKRKETAVGYHQLGNLAAEEREWREARLNYREALKIWQEFNDRDSQAIVYHQLGSVALGESDWEEAKRNYREALKIKLESNDRYGLGSTYHQLGAVAFEEHDWEKAKRNYQKALKIFQEFSSRSKEAKIYHELGMVAEARHVWAEAKYYYQEALKIDQEFNDRFSQALTYNQLGSVAAKETDYKSSLDYFVLALEIFSEYKEDDYNIKMTVHNLSLLLSLADWDAAEAIEALETTEEMKKTLRVLLKKIKTEPT